MNRRQVFIYFVLGGVLLLQAACSLISPATSAVRHHNEPLPAGRPICSNCHDNGTQLHAALKAYGEIDHSTAFIADHRLAATRDEQTCAICHATSFCNDCHANRIEFKPGTRYGNRPDREMIHRGDYLTRHRLDGKADPTSCYRCHGRANNEKCLTCHR